MPQIDAQDSASIVGLLLCLALAGIGVVRSRRAYKLQRKREKAAREQREAAQRVPGPWG